MDNDVPLKLRNSRQNYSFFLLEMLYNLSFKPLCNLFGLLLSSWAQTPHLRSWSVFKLPSFPRTKEGRMRMGFVLGPDATSALMVGFEVALIIPWLRREG